MTLPNRGERRKRSDPTSRSIAVFSLGFLLILSEACSVTSADKTNAAAQWSPARKARFFATPTIYRTGASGPARPASNMRNYDKSDRSYEEDKRLVHTGPNPLHN